MSTEPITGGDQVAANIRELLANQIPFAVSVALNRTANEVAGAERAHAARAFDRPTPFTLNAFGVTPSTKQDLSAKVFVKDRQATYLSVENEGGPRGFKTFEERFASDGPVQMMVPGTAAPRDQFGNVSKEQIVEIAKQLKRGKSAYFMGKPNGGSRLPGIYRREDGNRSIKPVLIETDRASYRPRLQFQEVAQTAFASAFPQNMQDAWERAITTMR